MPARMLPAIGVAVIAFAVLVWIIKPTIHGASLVVLVVALIAGMTCVVQGAVRRSRG